MKLEAYIDRENTKIEYLNIIMVKDSEILIKPLEKKKVPTLEELGYSFDMGM